MNIIELLDRPIAFHRCLVSVTGSVSGALLLSQAIYWQKRPTRESNDGWWYKTAEQWKEETGLTRREFEYARRCCAGVLLHEVRGVPATTWYKVDVDELRSKLAVQTRLAEMSNPVCTERAIQFVQNVQTICTKTKAENNTETKGGKPRLSIFDLKDIMAAKEELANDIYNCHASKTALVTHWSHQDKREEWLKLKQEIRELKNKIANYEKR